MSGERLSIEGDVPIRPCLTVAAPSSVLMKLLAVRSDVIARIDLEFGGLTLSYVRSGGHGPVIYRKSFFDEVRVDLDGDTPLDDHDLHEIFSELCVSLDARSGTATPSLVGQLEQLKIAQVPDFHNRT